MKLELNNVKDGNLGYYEFKKGKVIIEKIVDWVCYFKIEHPNYNANEVWRRDVLLSIDNEPYVNARLGKIYLKDVIQEDGTNLSYEIKKESYREFNEISIGTSDIATLIMVGCPVEESDELITKPLYFGADGDYKAYYINEDNIDIPGHYEKIAEFSTWLKIYDDTGLTSTIKGERIEVFRAYDFGCIIKVSDKKIDDVEKGDIRYKQLYNAIENINENIEYLEDFQICNCTECLTQLTQEEFDNLKYFLEEEDIEPKTIVFLSKKKIAHISTSNKIVSGEIRSNIEILIKNR